MGKIFFTLCIWNSGALIFFFLVSDQFQLAFSSILSKMYSDHPIFGYQNLLLYFLVSIVQKKHILQAGRNNKKEFIYSLDLIHHLYLLRFQGGRWPNQFKFSSDLLFDICWGIEILL